ncbi:hypothetical protein AMTRI_Chr05g57680 [Amborella trichopoda]
MKNLEHLPLKTHVSEILKGASQRVLNAFVDSVFQFVDQPTTESQSNFAPVEEIGKEIRISSMEVVIAEDFPEGIYIRNGPNPLYGALQSSVSVFGKSSHIWVEGEGMLHALYFNKDSEGKRTFKIEKERGKRTFLPAIEGDSSAIWAAYLLNQLRFGKFNPYISNTNVFEHAGKLYSIAENHLPQEIEAFSLMTLDNWNTAPGTGVLVIMGVDAMKPYCVLGSLCFSICLLLLYSFAFVFTNLILSFLLLLADGERLIHKADLEFERSSLCHEIGVTEKYNVIMDLPLTMNWFEVKPHCTFHVLNSYKDGDEVVVRGCRANGSIIPGPDFGLDKSKFFSRGFRALDLEKGGDPSIDGIFLSRMYEWRLNMKNGEVTERNLTGEELSMEFSVINSEYIGLRNKYGYAQVVDSMASAHCGLPTILKYGKFAKLCFEEIQEKIFFKFQRGSENMIKIEYHELAENQFCSGLAFVAKPGQGKEDEGWLISFVHNEDTNLSQVYIIDVKNFCGGPVAKITLPKRVPYGFHSAFISKRCIRKPA